jgi:hypothetical protein
VNNTITASSQACFLSCARKFYWQHECGLQHESQSMALRVGSAWHRAMEARAKNADMFSAAIPDAAEFDEITVATITGLLMGYVARYGLADNLFSFMHPEQQFRLPLAGSRTFTVAGKIDGLGKLHDERLAIFEAKTTSDSLDADSDYWLRLKLNIQIMQYVLAARALGWEVATVIYDVTRKPSIAPKSIPCLDDDHKKIVQDASGQRIFKKDGTPRESGDTALGYVVQTRQETPEEFGERLTLDTQARPEFYFARREVSILEDDLTEFQVARLTISRDILTRRAAQKRVPRPEQAWPRNVGHNCLTCTYQGFCLQNTTINLEQPPIGYKVGVFNPELCG